MATSTPKLALRKPDGADLVNVIADIGDNCDKLDVNPGTFVGTAAARAALAGTALWAGRQAIETDTGLEYVYDGAAWVEWNRWTQWTQYTPTWITSGAAPAVGNGTLIGRWRRRGKSLELRIQLTCGTTTTYGAIVWYFSLPAGLAGHGVGDQIGSAMASDAGVGSKNGVVFLQASLPSYIVCLFDIGAAGGGLVYPSATAPHAWGTGDTCYMQMLAELA